MVSPILIHIHDPTHVSPTSLYNTISNTAMMISSMISPRENIEIEGNAT